MLKPGSNSLRQRENCRCVDMYRMIKGAHMQRSVQCIPRSFNLDHRTTRPPARECLFDRTDPDAPPRLLPSKAEYLFFTSPVWSVSSTSCEMKRYLRGCHLCFRLTFYLHGQIAVSGPTGSVGRRLVVLFHAFICRSSRGTETQFS